MHARILPATPVIAGLILVALPSVDAGAPGPEGVPATERAVAPRPVGAHEPRAAAFPETVEERLREAWTAARGVTDEAKRQALYGAPTPEELHALRAASARIRAALEGLPEQVHAEIDALLDEDEAHDAGARRDRRSELIVGVLGYELPLLEAIAAGYDVRTPPPQGGLPHDPRRALAALERIEFEDVPGGDAIRLDALAAMARRDNDAGRAFLRDATGRGSALIDTEPGEAGERLTTASARRIIALARLSGAAGVEAAIRRERPDALAAAPEGAADEGEAAWRADLRWTLARAWSEEGADAVGGNRERAIERLSTICASALTAPHSNDSRVDTAVRAQGLLEPLVGLTRDSPPPALIVSRAIQELARGDHQGAVAALRRIERWSPALIGRVNETPSEEVIDDAVAPLAMLVGARALDRIQGAWSLTRLALLAEDRRANAPETEQMLRLALRSAGGLIGPANERRVRAERVALLRVCVRRAIGEALARLELGGLLTAMRSAHRDPGEAVRVLEPLLDAADAQVRWRAGVLCADAMIQEVERRARAHASVREDSRLLAAEAFAILDDAEEATPRAFVFTRPTGPTGLLMDDALDPRVIRLRARVALGDLERSADLLERLARARQHPEVDPLGAPSTPLHAPFLMESLVDLVREETGAYARTHPLRDPTARERDAIDAARRALGGAARVAISPSSRASDARLDRLALERARVEALGGGAAEAIALVESVPSDPARFGPSARLARADALLGAGRAAEAFESYREIASDCEGARDAFYFDAWRGMLLVQVTRQDAAARAERVLREIRRLRDVDATLGGSVVAESFDAIERRARALRAGEGVE